MSSPARSKRLLLLRHGEVTSHRGDVPVTDTGLETARAVGERFGENREGRILILSGETRRARDTAQAIANGAQGVGAAVEGPRVAFALRNPDLYVGGVRVNMVSSALALAEQVPGLTEANAAVLPFFADFLTESDRIGWWLRHPEPPGEGADTVWRRIRAFAQSLADPCLDASDLIVGVTHSPVLRACALAMLGEDPGEPDWVSGLEILIHFGGSVELRWFDRAP